MTLLTWLCVVCFYVCDQCSYRLGTFYLGSFALILPSFPTTPTTYLCYVCPTQHFFGCSSASFFAPSQWFLSSESRNLVAWKNELASCRRGKNHWKISQKRNRENYSSNLLVWTVSPITFNAKLSFLIADGCFGEILFNKIRRILFPIYHLRATSECER